MITRYANQSFDGFALFLTKIYMKLSEFYKEMHDKYPNKLKIIQKGAFCICINQEAFLVSKIYHIKLSKLDRESIKIGFPMTSLKKWCSTFSKSNLGYVVFGKEKEILDISEGIYIGEKFSLNFEDYDITKKRILGLAKLDLEQKVSSNFLLEQKVRDVYALCLDFLLHLPRKERYFLREKIEKVFLDTFELIFKYKYNLGERKKLMEQIFGNILILKEFFSLLYNIKKIKSQKFYLDIGEKFLEILKISKAIKNKEG